MPDEITFPAGNELYDAIMSQIEPELMLGELPKLKERFEKDTEEEKKQRQLRYLKAYVQFDQAFDELVEDPLDRLTIYRHQVLEKGNNAQS